MNDSQREQSKAKRLQLFDELCQSDSAQQFPATDSVLVENEDVLPATYDDFYTDYASMFQTSLTVLQPLENRLKKCEETINRYAQLFFKQENDEFIPVKKPIRSFSLSAEEIDKLVPNSELATILKRRKQISLSLATDADESERNTVENLTYKPFQPHVYQDWLTETAVEVLDVIDKVTEAQEYPENFHFYWNKIIRSETSQHLVMDSFWWVYLQYFVKLPNAEDECEKYFNRIAKNYVELLLSVDPWFRDKFFNIYGSYLAQAIYMAFYETCPDSRLSFNDKFKEFVASTVTEWISGNQATPESYKQWKIQNEPVMITSDRGLEQKSSSPADIFKKIRRLEEELEGLGGHEGDETVRSTMIKSPSVTPRKRASFTGHTLAEFEDDLFSLSNQSTLVARFLEQCDIQPNMPLLRNIHRMHVREWPKNKR